MSTNQFWMMCAIALWLPLVIMEFRAYWRLPIKAERRVFLRWELLYRWAFMIAFVVSVVLSIMFLPFHGFAAFVVLVLNIVIGFVLAVMVRVRIRLRVEDRGFDVVPYGEVWIRHENWAGDIPNRRCWYNTGSFYQRSSNYPLADLWKDSSCSLKRGETFTWYYNNAGDTKTIINRGRGAVVRPWKFWLPQELRQPQKVSV